MTEEKNEALRNLFADFNSDAMAAELERRDKESKELTLLGVPVDIGPAHLRVDKLRKAVVANKKEEESGNPDPDEPSIYEAAMELFYGDTYWDWLKIIHA